MFDNVIESENFRIGFLGAAPDTGNMGVSALCFSTLQAISTEVPGAEFTVFDHGRGVRNYTFYAVDGEGSFTGCGLVNSRRFYRPENIRLNQLCGVFPWRGPVPLEEIRSCSAVLAISGGDSFTDLYGKRVFDTVSLPQLLVMQQQKPLILLPQTYGPFNDPEIKKVAARIVKGAAMSWARDEDSFAIMKDLLGDDFDSCKHFCGVDMAFGLQKQKPVLDDLAEEIFGDKSKTSVVGINVSGLLFAPEHLAKFNLKADYRKTVLTLVRKFLDESDCTVALIPHVQTPPGHYESDLGACMWVKEQLDGANKDRIFVVPNTYNQSEVKWIISRCLWFCGTRMHSTIAALSSGVPCAAISYSDKTAGVFATCGQGSHVADPRKLDTEDVMDNVWASWSSRHEAADALKVNLSEVMDTHRHQVEVIGSFLKSLQGKTQNDKAVI